MRWLVAIAHPDDEVLACGGTIALLADRGDTVRVVLSLERSDPRGRAHWPELLDGLAKSCNILGADLVVVDPLVSEADAQARHVELHDALAPHVEWCERVITHHPGDVHQAHRAIARAVEVGTRPFRRRRDVYLAEVLTSTDQAYRQTFSPTVHVELSEAHVDRKTEAMACYPMETAWGRSVADVRRHAAARGATIGVAHAEAFEVARQFGL